MKLRLALLTAASVALMAGTASARDQIRIVGSSTVFPFATAVAEQFGKKTEFATPIIESTGSGGGMKLFCAGVGADHPDITNASRRMKAKEWKMCQENGVTEIIEVKIGFDGIVVGNAISAPDFDLSRKDLFDALAAQTMQYGRLDANKTETWSDVSPALPATPIKVIGPPPTSGTRDAFEELALQEGGEEAGLDKDAIKKIAVREDGAYVEAGENDNLIVAKLEADPTAVGVFGFSFLDQNSSKIKGAKVGGVEPTFENIASGDYPLSRSLYFYVKKAHIGVIPGLEEYLAEFGSDGATGEEGYTVEKGLIPLVGDERAQMVGTIEDKALMTGNEIN